MQELLSCSTFPIPPERLIEMTKDVVRAGEHQTQGQLEVVQSLWLAVWLRHTEEASMQGRFAGR
jgi:hypothetical protein